MNTTLMGMPSPDGQHVAAVGPTAEGGILALADSTAGLPSGIRYPSTSGPREEAGDGGLPAEPAAAAGGPLVQAESPLGGADPKAGSVRADTSALARADWLVQLGAWVNQAFAPEARDQLVISTGAAGPEVASMDRNDSLDRPGGADRSRRRAWLSMVQADLGAPLSLIVAAAVSYRLRLPVRKWWRRHGPAAAGWNRSLHFFARGPHFRSRRAETTRRIRKPASPV
jgi:hypothetical protein